MTEKIYEYRQKDNWFIGKWKGRNTLKRLGTEEDSLYYMGRLLNRIHPYYQFGKRELDGFDVSVVKMDSEFALIRFVCEMIREETGRNLKVVQHQGATLVTEGEDLLMVYLLEERIKLTDFFGQAGVDLPIGDTILIATHNEGKTEEFRHFFAKFGYQVENLNQYSDLPEVEETGMTFEENARLKAETISRLTGRMVLADDSGLKVDKLGGLPGVWSARFSGPDATDAKNNAKLLHELAMVFDLPNRSAQFHCTLVLAAPHQESLVVEADWEGYIGFEPRGEKGFGYDPLFLVGETGQTAAELSLEEKTRQSHRAKALEKLVEVFPAWQVKR